MRFGQWQATLVNVAEPPKLKVPLKCDTPLTKHEEQPQRATPTKAVVPKPKAQPNCDAPPKQLTRVNKWGIKDGRRRFMEAQLHFPNHQRKQKNFCIGKTRETLDPRVKKKRTQYQLAWVHDRTDLLSENSARCHFHLVNSMIRWCAMWSPWQPHTYFWDDLSYLTTMLHMMRVQTFIRCPKAAQDFIAIRKWLSTTRACQRL